jgi:hypothetical protein
MNAAKSKLAVLAIVLALSASTTTLAGAVGTAFTYQGQLTEGGSPANGTYDFRFALYDDPDFGSQVGSVVTIADEWVSNGLVTVQLDFGNVYDGTALWLWVLVRPGDSSGPYTPLWPRQPLTAVPFALYALEAPGSGGGGNTLGQAYNEGGPGAGRTIIADAGAVEVLGPDGLIIAGAVQSGSSNSIVIDGTANTITSDGDLEFHVGSGRALRIEAGASPNIVGGHAANQVDSLSVGGAILGGGSAEQPNLIGVNYQNLPYNVVVGGRGNVIDGTAEHAVIGGGQQNSILAPAATVSGGTHNAVTLPGDYAAIGGGYNNRVEDYYATVGGGGRNVASGPWSTVAGGELNHASSYHASVGGGIYNQASGDYSTISGGDDNEASGWRASVGGGWYNRASGEHATIPGGEDNLASGARSFAAGTSAWATHDGSFVWSCTSGGTNSTAANEFVARAYGGFRFYTASGTGTGARLAPGGGSWTSLSDRNFKENIEPVDPVDILERLASLDVTTWNYKSQDASIRHMGPMAQDFYSAFGLGEDEKGITSVDADGVGLAAIQGLYRLLLEKEAQITAQGELISTQADQVADLGARLARLEAAMAELSRTEKGGPR